MKTFIEPPNMVFPNIKAFFTTKMFEGGFEHIIKKLNIPQDNIYLPIQKHTDRVHIIESDFTRRVADSVLTQRKRILIGVQVADCVPILLYDRDKSVVGAVHAGWRGTAERILKNTIGVMHKAFDSSPENILIAFGPSIKQCCYEVGYEVKDAVCKTAGEGDYYHKQGSKYFIDLSYANKIQALSAGVLEQNIWQSGECTFCNPDRFYSYRYAKATAGRQGGFIGIW